MKLFLLIPACLLTLTVAAEDLSVQTYPVRFTDPEDAAEIIALMLQPADGLQVHAIDRKLVVKGTAQQQKEVQQMLSELDAPPKNIQIDVQFNRSGSSSGLQAGIQQRGPIIIRNGEVHASMGGRFSNRSATVTENTRQWMAARPHCGSVNGCPMSNGWSNTGIASDTSLKLTLNGRMSAHSLPWSQRLSGPI